HFFHRIGAHGDVALGVDELRAIRAPERALRVDRIFGLTETDSEREAGPLALLRCGEEGVPGPALRQRRVRRGAGRIHFRDVDPGVLLQQVDASAGPLDLAAERRRYRDP